MFLVTGVFVSARAASEDKSLPKVGPVKISPHPISLEGKTVLLRWNGKFNGDKFLNRVGELLTQQVKNVRVIKMWEVDSSTAVISKNAEGSSQVTEKISKLKPDIVIAAQADWGICTSWLVVDQLNLEKKGIPTVTIVTTAFQELIKSTMKDQGVSEMAIVMVEHPIAGHNLEGIRKKVDSAFPVILKAATQWQAGKK